MKNEIEYAVREAFEMNLGVEQSIKFIMRVSSCDRDAAKAALIQYQNRIMMAH